MQNVLQTAILQHQSGQLGPAAQLYQSVVAREPENAEALTCSACFAISKETSRAPWSTSAGPWLCGRTPPSTMRTWPRLIAPWAISNGPPAAAAPPWRSGRITPKRSATWARPWHGLGQHAESIEHLRRALELRPNFAVAHNNLGISLRELGQEDEALEHFRRAVELEPAFAPAQTNLGQALLDRGQAEEALPHCQEAVRLDPNSAVMHHNLAQRAAGAGPAGRRPGRVPGSLRLNPNLAVAMPTSGSCSQREGQLADALVWLKKAVELEPNNATCHWEWLAELYDELDEPDESIPCWEQVLALRPERPGPHVSLGSALQDAGRRAEAREHYLEALEIQPDSGPAHLNLGGLHEELGEMAEAEAAFRTALKLQPEFAPPHARLATLLRHKLPDDDLAALEARLADDKLGQGPRARLLFGLAHVLDGRGEYARAADCLQQANALTLELARGRNVYHPDEHERFVDGLIHAFDRDFLARLAGAGPDTRRPVFVFGLPRSGTTLIEQVLASHSQIHGAGELRIARRTFDAIPAVLGRSGPPRDCLAHLDRATVPQLAEQHLADLAAIDGGRNERIVDKMPDNYLYLGLAGRSVPAGRVHPLPPRPARRGRVVLDDRLPQHSLGQRSRPHRHALPAVSPDDGPLAGGSAGADPSRRLRGDGDRPRVGGAAADRRLRRGLGTGLPGVPSHGAARPHRQHQPGPAAGVSAVGGPMEELRRGVGGPVRGGEPWRWIGR